MHFQAEESLVNTEGPGIVWCWGTGYMKWLLTHEGEWELIACSDGGSKWAGKLTSVISGFEHGQALRLEAAEPVAEVRP